MQAIITQTQQNALLKKQALNRLSRTALAEQLGLSIPTVRSVLDTKPPFAVNSKTFTAVNNWLIEQLDD
ncbi:hypothetical protein JOC36_000840 [Weissella uvarum]|uniref:hypothetical protein n=1 Tax=Bacilli TaxID=91061 RepID=UPI00195F38B7|nr:MULTISPECIES: hypothetical protein [Bacilli]MBM7617291.1 hypothetical protein [Weissella uvarum]MCM0595206.1 hypothetical protein [Weissella uvarum]MCM0601471.1 hypothetical protein [Periweissella ghanensis]MDA5653787.1 hypothetical protein [Staphylococcus aureus]